MQTITFFLAWVGIWTGQYDLYLAPNEKPLTSPSTLQIEQLKDSDYLILRLTWEYKSRQKESVFLIGINGTKVEAVWADTWHMSPFPMICKGEFNSGEKRIEFLGSYSTGEDSPDWFWRTRFEFSEDSIRMKVFNINPEGKSMPAIDASYTRQPR